MKRLSVLVLAVVFALGAPSAVGAAKKKYEGAFAAGGTNSFTLKKTNRGKRVFNYEWDGFLLACDGGPETSSNGLNFSVNVKRKKFETVATPSTLEKAKLTIKGKFTGRSKAEGMMRLQGTRVPVDSGGKDSCDSGKVAWNASRVTG